MSDNQMISVARDEVERLVKLLQYQAHPHPSPHAEFWQGLLDNPSAQAQGDPVAYDPAKETKQFEAWARAQPQVDLRLCDIGLYYARQTGLAHDAWQHRAKLAEQPAPGAVALGDRSLESYAIEHAEYMAKSADDVLAQAQAYGMALFAVDEGGDDSGGELFEALDTARSDLQESLVYLRGMVYEFRKRSARIGAVDPDAEA